MRRVSVAAPGVGSDDSLRSRVDETLSRAQIPAELVESSPMRLTWAAPGDAAERVVALVHCTVHPELTAPGSDAVV